MKRIITIFLVLIILISTFSINASASYKPQGFEVVSKSAVLISLDTGDVLFEKNADEKCYPASVTKVMTAVLLYEYCDNLDQKVIITQEDMEGIYGKDLATAGFSVGEEVSLEVCLNLTLVSSSADATMAIANFLEKETGKQIETLMNDKAKELKMTNTHFTNPVGWHDENHYTTANDLVKLCKYAISLPNFTEICSQYTYTIPKTNKRDEFSVATTNELVNPYMRAYYSYATGIKTGYTEEAGRCLASSASKDGYNYMCVILGGDNLTRSEFSDSKNLYEWAFSNFEYRTVADINTMVAEMDVKLSKETDFVQLYPENNVTVIMPKDIDNESIIYDPVLSENSVWAPLQKNQILGYVSIKCAGEEIAKVNIINKDEIKRSTSLYIGEIFRSIVTSAWFIAIVVAFFIILVLLIIMNIISNKRRLARLKRVKRIKKL